MDPLKREVSTTETEQESGSVDLGWAILELMGHRRLGGYVSEETHFGAALCRIDVPGVEGKPEVTQYYSATAIYAITPTTEAIARAVALRYRPEPVHPFELPPPKVEPVRNRSLRFDDDDDHGHEHDLDEDYDDADDD